MAREQMTFKRSIVIVEVRRFSAIRFAVFRSYISVMLFSFLSVVPFFDKILTNN